MFCLIERSPIPELSTLHHLQFCDRKDTRTHDSFFLDICLVDFFYIQYLVTEIKTSVNYGITTFYTLPF